MPGQGQRRVGGVIQVTRALGDRKSKPMGVVALPQALEPRQRSRAASGF